MKFYVRSAVYAIGTGSVILAVLIWAGVFARFVFRYNYPICRNCNVVLVSLESLRADDLPCYGYSRNTAPNLCAFAKKGALFNRYYSQSSVTLDSYFSIFTGLYPTTHHMIDAYRDTLNPSIQTLTQMMKKSNYDTLYFGTINDPYIPLTLGFGRGFDEIHPIPDKFVLHTEYEPFLKRLNSKKQTFMFIHTYWLHDPYLAGHGTRLYVQGNYPSVPLTNEEFRVSTIEFYKYVLDDYILRLENSDVDESQDRSTVIIRELQEAIKTNDLNKGKYVMNSLMLPEENFMYYSQWYWRDLNKRDPNIITYIRGLYDERIHSLDAELKPLLDYVSRPEVKRHTIVIITAGHGDEFMEHGHVSHDTNIYNSVTHVPFIVVGPRIRPGMRHDLSQSVDIYPTVLAMTGVTPAQPAEGINLLPILTGDPNAVGETYSIGEHRGDFIQSITDGTWKLYNVNKNTAGDAVNKKELYNIVRDPLEQRNVVLAYPAIEHTLEQALTGILQKSPHVTPMRGDFPLWIDQRIRNDLIQKGYF